MKLATWPRLQFLGLTLAACGIGPAAAAAAAHGASGQSASLASFIDLFNSGNQAAYEQYFAEVFDPEAIEQRSAAERADRLARLFEESGGFSVQRPGRDVANAETARVVARTTRLPYCVTLTRGNAGIALTDFTAEDLPLAASPALRTPDAGEVSRVMTRFFDRLSQADLFSGGVLIARHGRPFLVRSYGHESLAFDRPNHANTRFNVASIGKSLTAVVTGQLVDEGLIDLGGTVGQYLPDYPDTAVRDRVTVRQLLSHTSGLGDASEYVSDPQWPQQRPRLRAMSDYLPLIVGHPLESEPGARYQYSNAGYVILGLIIERLTGQTFQEAVQDRVFSRAGMSRSFYHEMDAQDRDVAVPLTHFIEEGGDYRFQLGPRRDGSYQLAARGGAQGGAFMTASDLHGFMLALRQGRLTSLQTARLLTTPQPFGRNPENRTALGFEVLTHNGHTIIGHTGGDIGVSAFFYHFADTDYDVVVLSNYDPRAIRAIDRQIRGLITRSTIGAATPEPSTNC